MPLAKRIEFILLLACILPFLVLGSLTQNTTIHIGIIAILFAASPIIAYVLAQLVSHKKQSLKKVYLPLLGTHALLVVLLFGVHVLFMLLYSVVLFFINGNFATLTLSQGAIGAFLLLIATIIYIIFSAFTVPALMYDKKKYWAAVSHSWYLVRTHFWHFTSKILLAMVVGVFMIFLVYLLLILLQAVFNYSDAVIDVLGTLAQLKVAFLFYMHLASLYIKNIYK